MDEVEDLPIRKYKAIIKYLKKIEAEKRKVARKMKKR